ncbi:MAG: ABC transporter [Alphaproteobacteria bacterium]|nr:MAG: ABC transporter [Alphaproteobacteria bacterium]
MQNRRFLFAATLVSLAVLLVGVNVMASRLVSSARIDLTADRLYTLSAGTRQVLRDIPDTVTLRLFLSERLVREVPAYGSYATRVRDLLREYVAAANGRLVLQVFDPLPYSDVEDRATALGLQGVPVDQTGELVYFGLAGANTTDDEEVITFFQPERERFLEIDLTRMVHALSRPKRRVVGVLSSLPIEGDALMGRGQPQSWAIVDQLRQTFDLRTLGPDITAVPEGIDALMLVHPAGLSDRALYAIDQYALSGGRLLVLADPHSEAAAMRGQAMMMRGMPASPTASSLGRLGEAWGVDLVGERVVGDRRLARRVQAGSGPRAQAADYIAWLAVPAEYMTRDDPVTGQLQTLALASAGILEAKPNATTRFEPLVQSSPVSMQVPVDRVRASQPDIVGLLRQFQSGGQSLTVAARVTGPIRTAFPDGPPPAEAAAGASDTATPLAPHRTEGTLAAILIADTDLLEDRFWVQMQNFFGQQVAQPISNNADLIANALDSLTGSQALLGLRARGIQERPFTVVRDIQQAAETRFREKEQGLQDRLRETERRLAELRGGQGQQSAALTPEQARQIEQFRADLVQTRGELRQVQRDLREDIEGLRAVVQALNIAAMPVLVAVFAIGVGVVRRSRRRA